MGKESDNEIYSITILRNISLILVILGHAGCIYAGKWSYTIVNNKSFPIRYITEYIYSFHMPLFIFISGYIYRYSREKRNKYKYFSELIVNKSKRLLIPYFMTGILFMIPIQIIFNVYHDKQSFFNQVMNGIVMGKNSEHLWYLLMLFNLFVIFYFIEKILDMKRYVFNFIIFTLIAIISIKVKNIYEISITLKYIVYFYMGYIAYIHTGKIGSTKKYKNIILVLYLILFNIDFFIINNINYGILMSIFKIIFHQTIAMLGITYIFINIMQLSKCDNIVKKINESKIYIQVNKNNFYIYLFHQPIMLAIVSVIRNMDIDPFVLYIILFSLTLIVSIVISNIINKLKNINLRLKILSKQGSK